MECASFMVCIVDDDNAVRDSLRALLESYGLTVFDFDCAAAYLSAKPAVEPGCLIVDLHMPGLDGLELIELLRRRKVQTPAILLTGRHDDQAAQRARDSGVLKLLHKPVLADDLKFWIDRAFSARDTIPAVRH